MTQRIVLKGHSRRHYKEGNVSTAITPGMIIGRDSSGNIFPNTVGGAVKVDVAVEDNLTGTNDGTLTIDRQWAVNSQGLYQSLGQGDEFLALVYQGSSAIAFGDYIDADGTNHGCVVKSPSSATRATVTVGGTGKISFTARLPGDEGNGITLQILAASGAGSVVTTASAIVVTPAAAADTATATAAQLNADPIASVLGTAAVTASGGSSTGIVAATPLAGGAEGGLGVSKLVARQAVDNSGGSAPVRIRLEVI